MDLTPYFAIDAVGLAAHQVEGRAFAEWAAELLANDPDDGTAEAFNEAADSEATAMVGSWRTVMFLDEFRNRVGLQLAAAGHAALRDELLAYPSGWRPGEAPAVISMLDHGEL